MLIVFGARVLYLAQEFVAEASTSDLEDELRSPSPEQLIGSSIHPEASRSCFGPKSFSQQRKLPDIAHRPKETHFQSSGG